MELQKPDYLLSLASAGILVNVECSTWGATKKDNKVTEEVTSAYKSDKDSADVVVNLMANVKEHKEILKYRNDIRNWLRRWTYDWAGSSPLLAHDAYREVQGRVQHGVQA
jgi:hypothetical protein